MNTVTIPTEDYVFNSVLKPMNDGEFFELCQSNPDLHIEMTSTGDLIIMPPTGGETGHRNATLTAVFHFWAEADGTGVDFDSSPVFRLPNGAKRSPDVAWIRRSRWEALTQEEREKFPPLCPDFVIELRSRTDDLATLKAKMEEYVANGAQLGWLIDPLERKVSVYRPQAPLACLDQPEELSGEPELPGLRLLVSRLWPK